MKFYAWLCSLWFTRRICWRESSYDPRKNPFTRPEKVFIARAICARIKTSAITEKKHVPGQKKGNSVYLSKFQECLISSSTNNSVNQGSRKWKIFFERAAKPRAGRRGGSHYEYTYYWRTKEEWMAKKGKGIRQLDEDAARHAPFPIFRPHSRSSWNLKSARPKDMFCPILKKKNFFR